MSKLQTFLDDLTDWELANFHKYRYDQFIKASQVKIDDEILKRGMQLDNVKFEPTMNEVVCPRCYSTKYYDSTEIESVTYSYATVDFEVDVRTCLVCLYSGKSDQSDSKDNFVGPVGFLSRLINRKK